MGIGVISWVVMGTGLEALHFGSEAGISRVLTSAAVGATFGLPFGLLLPSFSAMLAGLTLLALAPGRPVASGTVPA